MTQFSGILVYKTSVPDKKTVIYYGCSFFQYIKYTIKNNKIIKITQYQCVMPLISLLSIAFRQGILRTPVYFIIKIL